MSEVKEELYIPVFKRGLTWRVFMAMVTAALLFIPISTYLYLTSGTAAATVAVYVIVILFSFFSRIWGNPLTKQELFIIYTVVGYVGGSVPFCYWLVYRGFFLHSPIASSFHIMGKPLSELVPFWMAPGINSEAYKLRTLLHPDWFWPLTISIIYGVLGFLAEISLAMMASYLFIEVEPLRFPFATISADMVTVLAERKVDEMKYFITCLLIGFIYGIILYVAPLFGVQIIPLPWIDLTWLTEKYLPGALIGIATDPSSFLFGFLLPIHVAGCTLLGSVITWIIFNTLFLTVFPNFFPEWTEEYFQGMTIASIIQRSSIRVWLSPSIGFAVGLAFILTVKLREKIVQTFKALRKIPLTKKETGYLSIPKLIFMYLIGTGGSVIIYHFLVPEIPILIPLSLSLGLSFFIAIFSTRIFGELGLSVQFPYLWQSFVYFSPYQGFAGWVFTPVIAGFGTAGYVNTTKAAYLTETRISDFYKALTISVFLNILFGIIFMDFFWKLAPLPSTVYPQTLVFWPTYAITECLLATRQIHIDPTLIMLGSGASVGIFILGEILTRIGIPFNAVALIGGLNFYPPSTIMTFIGSLIGKLVLQRYFGENRWWRMRGIVVAGILVGTGLALGVGTSLALLQKASWVMPW